jgi:RHS repeat-associated protein
VMILLRLLPGESTTTYASSKLKRVGRRAARYDSGLSAHKCNRPAHKRPTPHRIAHECIACSRSRCGNSTPFTKRFPLPPVNPCQHLGSLPFAAPVPSSQHNHARYDSFGNVTNSTGTLRNPFSYTASEFDSETNLYYYRARYYDPSKRRVRERGPCRFRRRWRLLPLRLEEPYWRGHSDGFERKGCSMNPSAPHQMYVASH